MLQNNLALSGAVAQSASSLSPLGVVDIEQVCALLGVSRWWIEQQIRRDRTFPRCFKIGARRHVKLSDLQAWVEAHARAA
ncbi:MAG TPA: helix-turn-helix domain-containing protein [Hyphomicrobium sp.]|nr:helix-turn-helix domain-containing protein [Hyphomicrobium sp.]